MLRPGRGDSRSGQRLARLTTVQRQLMRSLQASLQALGEGLSLLLAAKAHPTGILPDRPGCLALHFNRDAL